MPEPQPTLVHGARLPEGAGLSRPCDILISGGRIAAITPASPNAGSHPLDADGRVCLPGFIDAHCHASSAVFDTEIQLALLRQGVTTIVVGQDGIGYAPSTHNSYDWTTSYFAGVDGANQHFGPGTMAQWLASYDNQVPVNVAAFTPHGSLRYMVSGAAQRPSTRPEIERMAQLLEASMDDGSLGLSTGLEYVPAAWASRDELAVLLRVVAQRGRLHSSHMRGYESAAPEAVAELVDLARTSGAATHIAHYHGDARVLGPLIDQACDAGVTLTFDSYPYLRGCSLLAMVSLPTWLPLADPSATIALLASDPGARQRLTTHLSGLGDLWTRTTMAWVSGSDPVTGRSLDWVAGHTLPEVARCLAVSPADAVMRLLIGTGLGASCVFAQPPTNSASSVLELADRHEHMAGSDAIYSSGRPHPRGWGAMARWLKVKVVLDGAWSWADAADHLAGRAVRRFGLGERGRIAIGAVADLMLVDPSQLEDKATYDHPRLPATGIDDVLVAGVPVLAGGHLTGLAPGHGVRFQAATQ